MQIFCCPTILLHRMPHNILMHCKKFSKEKYHTILSVLFSGRLMCRREKSIRCVKKYQSKFHLLHYFLDMHLLKDFLVHILNLFLSLLHNTILLTMFHLSSCWPNAKCVFILQIIWIKWKFTFPLILLMIKTAKI